MREYLKLGTVLLIIAAVSASILAVVNSFTSKVIAENEFKLTVESYHEIFGDQVDDFEPFDEAELAKIKEEYKAIDNIFVAKKGGNVVGYGINVKGNGFGGEMVNAIGFLLDGKKIAGFRNVSNAETKGFGTKIAEDFYYNTYVDKDASQPLEGTPDGSGPNNVMIISGATVTSKAVIAADNIAIDVFNKVLAQ